MECPRGWILTTNDQGFFVPFFVKTRSVDVFYSNSVSDKFGTAGVITDEENIKIYPPGQEYHYNSGIWNVKLNNNESFTMGCKLDLAPEKLTANADGRSLRCTIELPFPVRTDYFIDVNITKSCTTLTAITAHTNVVLDTPSETQDIEKIFIDLYKSDGSTLTEADKQSGGLTDATNYLYVNISGVAQLGEYSHMDDVNQIGAEWDGSASGIGAKDVYTKQETENLIAALRADVKSGKVITPPNIVDVADDAASSEVLPTGILIDIDEDTTSTLAENASAKGVTTFVTEDDEINEKLEDPGVVHLDIEDSSI